MLTDNERLALLNDRTKPKWDFRFASQEFPTFALETNRELILDYSLRGPWLSGVVLAEGGFERFVDALEPGMITHMRAKCFDFTEPAMRSLSGALVRHRPFLLGVSGCSMNDACAEILANSLPPSLARLEVFMTRTSHVGLLAIVEKLARSSTAEDRVTPFTKLELGGIKMGDDGFAKVCEVLPRIKGLADLHVSSNELTERSLEAFAGVVNLCETLHDVFFSSNRITSLAPLCALLRETGGLGSLCFGENEALGDSTAIDLLRALTPHTLVWHIGLWRTRVSIETQHLIQDTLDQLRSRKTRALLTLLSVRGVRRFGRNSALRNLPNDHLRLVAAMLK